MPTYTLFDEISASHVNPLPLESQRWHMGVIKQGFDNILNAPKPTYQDWKAVTTAINLMEALIELGELQDPQGLHKDTCLAMATAADRYLSTGAPIRLDGPGIQAVRGLLEDYEEILKVLPHRTMIRAYRRIEAKVEKMFGKNTRRRGASGGF